MAIGQCHNKHLVDDVQIHRVAPVNLTKGMIVYEDGANGLKAVPTTAQPAVTRQRFLLQDANNTGGAVGNKLAETVKKGAKCSCVADGAIVAGTYVKASTNVAGRVMQWSKAVLDVTATPTETTIENALNALQDNENTKLGVYVGHVGEGIESGKRPTDAVNGEEVVIIFD